MGRVKKGDPKEFLTPILSLFKELKDQYPKEGIARHINTALSDYGDIWGLSDKELFYSLDKYKTMRENDLVEFDSDDSIERILKEGSNLDSILDEEDEEW